MTDDELRQHGREGADIDTEAIGLTWSDGTPREKIAEGLWQGHIDHLEEEMGRKPTIKEMEVYEEGYADRMEELHEEDEASA